MKFGQALSVFEAAVPPEIAGPYRAALTGCSSRPRRCPAPPCTGCWTSSSVSRWRDAVRGFRGHPRRGRLHRPGAPGGLGRRPPGRGQGPVPRRGRALLADLKQLSLFARLFGISCPAGGHAAAGRAGGPDRRGARLPAGGRRPSGLRRRPTPTTRRSVPKVVAGAAQGDGHRVDGRHAAVPDHRAGLEHGAPGRDSCSAFLYRARPGRGCCTPTRIRATSGCWRTGGSACWIRRGGPAAGRRAPVHRPAAADRARGRRMREAEASCASRASPARASRSTWPPCTPSWPRSPSRPGSRRSRSAASGCAAKPRGSPTRAPRLGRRLNLPPSYLLIHRVTTAGIGVLCQLESTGAFRAEMIRWMPGYIREGEALPGAPDGPGAGDVPDAGTGLDFWPCVHRMTQLAATPGMTWTPGMTRMPEAPRAPRRCSPRPC